MVDFFFVPRKFFLVCVCVFYVCTSIVYFSFCFFVVFTFDILCFVLSRLLKFFIISNFTFVVFLFSGPQRTELEGDGPRTRAGGRDLEGGQGGDVRILLYRCGGDRTDPSSEKTPRARTGMPPMRETPPPHREQLLQRKTKRTRKSIPNEKNK